jgi:hypothetical protein
MEGAAAGSGSCHRCVGHADDLEVSWKGVGGRNRLERREEERAAPDPLEEVAPAMHLLQKEKDKRCSRTM